MSRMNSGRALSDDDRFELAMGAAARERRNRPRGMVVAAGLLLLICGIVAITGLVARGSARAKLVQVRLDQAAIERMAMDWASMDEQESASANTGQPLKNLYSTLEDLATGRAGLKDKPKPPRLSAAPPRSGIVVNEYHYTDVKDKSLKALIEWARLATIEVPGLEVVSIDLTPDPVNWTMNVTFRRWERAG